MPVKITWPILTGALVVTLVGPVVENVATPSGTAGLEVQLAPVVHSLVAAPVQLPSAAWAATTPSAVVASRVGSE